MNIHYMVSLLAVVILFLLAYIGVEVVGLRILFGIVIPYLAVIVFLAGFFYRIMDWARSPVPFRIPTTAGQQKSLPWIKWSWIDNPDSNLGVAARMTLDVLFFRSLFRNTRVDLRGESRFSYIWEKWLWLAALAFHYAFLVVLIRHLRFFTSPVPLPVRLLELGDGFFQVGVPGIFISGIVLLAATIYLFARRLYIPQMRYISLTSDYFPLFLIIGIAFSGILMRYFAKVDVVGTKALAMGLVTFRPTIPEGGIGGLFYAHLFLVCVLLAYFPFSKLMHLGGIFMSPTRNMANTSRSKRHINPWNHPVKVHTYEEYEDDFREKMIEAGLPVDKE
jgi:nitrate reductase gamma subunit